MAGRIGGGARRLVPALAVACLVLWAAGRPACAADAYEERMAAGARLLETEQPAAAARAFAAAAELALAKGGAGKAQELAARRGQLRGVGRAFDLLGIRDVSVRIRELQLALSQELPAARTALDLGGALTDLGDPRGAAEVLRAALLVFEKLGKTRHVGQAHLRLADAYRQRRDYARALGHAEDARTVFEEQGGPSFADVLNQIGMIHLDLGDVPRARLAFDEALRQYGGKRPVQRADVLANLGIAEHVAGRTRAALAALDAAGATYAALGAGEYAARIHTHQGLALTKAGDFESALGKLDQATALLGEQDVLDAAYTRLYRGDVLLALGRAAEAKQVFTRARARGLALEDRHLAAEGERGLAAVALANGKPEDARAFIARSLERVNELVAGLTPTAGALGRHERRVLFDTVARVGMATQAEGLRFELLERSRAAGLLQQLGTREVLERLPVPARLQEAMATSRTAMVAARTHYAMTKGARDLPRALQARKRMQTAQLAYEDAVERARQSMRAQAPLALPEPVALAVVQAALAEMERLVLFAVTPQSAHALVVGPHTSRVADLGTPAALIAAIDALDVRNLEGRALAQAVETARTVLLAPLDLPAGVKRLLVSPDGPIGRVPFALLDRTRTVAFVPSGSVHHLLGSRRARKGGPLLALGDPVYRQQAGGRSLAVYAGSGRLSPLPGTREEITAIRKPGDVILLGSQATEGGFRDAVGQRAHWDTVLFACHGIANDHRPSQSGLALTPGPDHDGYVSALEVFGLRVPADLVVLSACDSGRGTGLRGDGMIGLAGAFLYAGTPRVLATLWKVEDQATRALMTRFHGLWRPEAGGRGLPAGEALAKAQAHVRQQAKWKHPRYWAAWVLWGRPD